MVTYLERLLTLKLFSSLITTRVLIMIAYLDGMLPIKSHDTLIMWPSYITWQTKMIISLLPQYLWQTNLARRWIIMKTTHSRSHIILQLHDFLCHVAYSILYISTLTRPMATKHGKVATFHKGIPPINSHNYLNTCSHEVTRQIKNTISPLS